MIGFRDHPRLRGEHPCHEGISKMILGSPPPTRGTHNNPRTYKSKAGITPAYAGNTTITKLLTLLMWDHPRLRGEHLSFFPYSSYRVGSPPPTRGTHYHLNNYRSFLRITPAYAGNTLPITALPLWYGITPAYAGNTKHLVNMRLLF